LKQDNIEWGKYLEFQLLMAGAVSEAQQRLLKRKYLKKGGLTSYSSETEKALEEKRPDPVCPNGHVMNFEPMTTLAVLNPIIKRLEAIRDWPSGTILNGYGHCVGKNYTCGRKIAEISYGWHICTHRPDNNCDYFMRCTDCFHLEIAEPQDLA